MLMAHKTEAGEAVVLISASWICRYSTHLVQPYIATYNSVHGKWSCLCRYSTHREQSPMHITQSTQNSVPGYRHWTHYVPWYITTHPVPYILYLHPWPPPYSRWEWIFQRVRDLVGFSENAGGGKVKLTANRGRAQFVLRSVELPWIFREDRRILEEGTYSQ